MTEPGVVKPGWSEGCLYVEVICQLTLMCPDLGVKSNLHDNKQGYELIAKTFFAIVKDIDFDD